ncbi:MAG TPA: hypothetical protein VJH24_05550, partial [Candidatus Bilamarchaeaceae archaeon]|nr:hypothetical protein [Candidatus Bilamarchaeaceae archaeon]
DVCGSAFQKLLNSRSDVFGPVRQYTLLAPERREILRKLGLFEITEKIKEEEKNGYPHVPPEIKARLEAEPLPEEPPN